MRISNSRINQNIQSVESTNIHPRKVGIADGRKRKSNRVQDLNITRCIRFQPLHTACTSKLIAVKQIHEILEGELVHLEPVDLTKSTFRQFTLWTSLWFSHLSIRLQPRYKNNYLLILKCDNTIFDGFRNRQLSDMHILSLTDTVNPINCLV